MTVCELPYLVPDLENSRGALESQKVETYPALANRIEETRRLLQGHEEYGTPLPKPSCVPSMPVSHYGKEGEKRDLPANFRDIMGYFLGSLREFQLQEDPEANTLLDLHIPLNSEFYSAINFYFFELVKKLGCEVFPVRPNSPERMVWGLSPELKKIIMEYLMSQSALRSHLSHFMVDSMIFIPKKWITLHFVPKSKGLIVLDFLAGRI